MFLVYLKKQKSKNGLKQNIQKHYLKLKVFLIGKDILIVSKKNGTIISMKNLKDVNKDIGSIIKVWLLTLLVLTICSCSGARLMLGQQIIGNQIDYSTFSGKLAKQTKDVMVYATSKTGGLVSPLWHHQTQLTKLQLAQTQDSVSYQNQGVMLKKCLLTR